MRHDIYYVLENWVPNLAENEIYQKLIKEIIPANQTYHVNDIWSEENLIELLPIDQGKTIRVDEVGKKGKKVEYSCCINGKGNTSYRAISAISEGEDTDLVYSYIEIYNLKSYDFFRATTVAISKVENNQYILKSVQAENCIYDEQTIGLFQELSTNLQKLSEVNDYTDYTMELRKVIQEERKKHFIIPDLQLSMDIVADLENKTCYTILCDGHNDFPNKQIQHEKKPLNELSLDQIIGRINYLFDDRKLTEAWNGKFQKIISGSAFDDITETAITAPSYSVDKFIEKVSLQSKNVKQKSRKDG